jgi:flagellar biosynthesis protein FliP
MKAIAIILLLTVYTHSSTTAQVSNKTMQELQQSSQQLDSAMKAAKAQLDSINIANYNRRNNEALTQFTERKKKLDAKQNWVRVGAGIAMLLFLILVWYRKKMQQK